MRRAKGPLLEDPSIFETMGPKGELQQFWDAVDVVRYACEIAASAADAQALATERLTKARGELVTSLEEVLGLLKLTTGSEFEKLDKLQAVVNVGCLVWLKKSFDKLDKNELKDPAKCPNQVKELIHKKRQKALVKILTGERMRATNRAKTPHPRAAARTCLPRTRSSRVHPRDRLTRARSQREAADQGHAHQEAEDAESRQRQAE